VKVGDLVKYSEEVAKNRQTIFLRNRAVYGGHNVSEWLGVIVDENPAYYFVKWMNHHFYDSEHGIAESKNELVVVS